MLKLKRIVISLGVLSLVLTSCNNKITSKGDKVPFISKKLVQQQYQKEYEFQSLDIKKAVISFETIEKTMRLNSRVKVLKDSIIQVSIKPGFGIEAFRINFTQDSIFIIDRLNKNIYLADYSYIIDSYNLKIGFDEIQKIILGQAFSLVRLNNERNFTVSRNEFYEVVSNNNDYREIDFFDKDLMFIQKQFNSKKLNKGLNLKYLKYTEVEDLKIAENIQLVIRDNIYNTKIKVNYKEIVKKENLSCNLNYSPKYTKIRLHKVHEN